MPARTHARTYVPTCCNTCRSCSRRRTRLERRALSSADCRAIDSRRSTSDLDIRTTSVLCWENTRNLIYFVRIYTCMCGGASMTHAGGSRRELSGLAFLLRGDGGRGDTTVLPSFVDKLHRSRSQLEENSFLESLEPAILLIWRGCFGSASHVFIIEKRCKTMYYHSCI